MINFQQIILSYQLFLVILTPSWNSCIKKIRQQMKVSNWQHSFLIWITQLINEPTHLTRNTSSCTDLIFTPQSNLVMESGVHSSLCKKWYHHITYVKFNLKIYYENPYGQELWHHQKENIEIIRKAVSEFPEKRHFLNSGVNEKVSLFNKTIKNIVKKWKITCNDRDSSWINKNIKKLINDKNRWYTFYRHNENSSFFQNFQYLQSRLNSLKEKSEHKYYACLSENILDPATCPKWY